MPENITISTNAFTDKKLNAKSRGVLAWLLCAQAAGTHISVRAMKDAGLGGLDAVRTALNELEREGYLIRNRSTDSNGRHVFTEYAVTDRPEI
jgi:hypothetical protein